MTETTTRTGRVDIPEGTVGRATVQRFTIEADSFENLRARMRGGRHTRPGTYTALRIGGRLWMSDTDAEWYDHMDAVRRIRNGARRVLINGLGIGMVVQAALDCEHVEHIDVVERDADVIALVGPHYEATGRVTIHHADAYDMQWPTGARWDVAWHDIWLDICGDNLDGMKRLHRKYGRRVDWQGSWSRELVERQVRREAAWRW